MTAAPRPAPGPYRRCLVGFDPGRSAALSLLVDRGAQRPELVAAWEIHGEDHLWYDRLPLAVAECYTHIVELRAAEAETWQRSLVWAEDWVPYARKDRDRERQHAWIGLGRRQGAFMAAWCQAAATLPTLVPPGNESPQHVVRARQGWTALLGVPPGKSEQDGGAHRIREAGMYVGGPVRERILACTSRARQIDLAESLLIAAAAGVHGRAMHKAGLS